LLSTKFRLNGDILKAKISFLYIIIKTLGGMRNDVKAIIPLYRHVAMGCYFDGQISAVIGAHTRVQTADEKVLPEGTEYTTDVGMTGPINSVIGMDKDKAINRFLTLIPQKFEPAKNDVWLHGVVIDFRYKKRQKP
jgi:YmdB-like protein